MDVKISDDSMIEKLNNIRKKYHIPLEYKGFINRNINVDVRMVQYLKKNIEDCFVDYENGKLKISGIYDYIKIKFEDTIIHYIIDEEDDDVTHFVFAPNKEIIERFYKEKLFTNDIVIPLLKPGFYKWEKTMHGPKLSLLNISKENPPILNENLRDSLIAEINNFVKKEEFYKKNKLAYKRGYLLYGVCGTGKSSFVKTMNIKDSITIIVGCNEADFIEETIELISSDLYKNVLKIIVFEDIDGVDSFNKSDLLNALDGVTETYKTIFIATTNHPEELDDAFTKRPSRFDTLYEIGLPDADTRKKIIQLYFKKVKGEELEAAVKETDGFTGAYIKELFLLTEYNNVGLLQAIKLMKKKFKDYQKFTGDQNYMG